MKIHTEEKWVCNKCGDKICPRGDAITRHKNSDACAKKYKARMKRDALSGMAATRSNLRKHDDHDGSGFGGGSSTGMSHCAGQYTLAFHYDLRPEWDRPVMHQRVVVLGQMKNFGPVCGPSLPGIVSYGKDGGDRTWRQEEEGSEGELESERTCRLNGRDIAM
ncbi:hypothetical protein PENSPDRAFT_739380 [Peniophora sp. CONT]|nr:hypothetical protein PENSPDRAFT_739380 [Peniophora sp. CONT]